MKLFTVEQMVAAEKAADAQGLTYERMMETAGRRLAEAMQSRYEIEGKRVLVLVGPGNNGGDGLVAGRYLAEAGAEVAFYLYKARDPAQDNNLAQVAGQPQQLMAEDEEFAWLTAYLQTADFLIDGLLGTGVSRPIEGTMADLLQQVTATSAHSVQAVVQQRRDQLAPSSPLINPAQPDPLPASPLTIIAVDCPSGLNCDTGALDPLALPAALTVTFAAPKWGHFLFPGAGACGELVVADIGIAADLPAVTHVQTEVATAELARRLLPPRPPDGHKGTFGKVLVVAGSHRYWGAPFLSALGALRAGSGLVALCVPQMIRATIAGQLPEATFVPVADEALLGGETAVSLYQAAADYDAILIGPGLADATDFIQTFFAPNRSDSLPPLVIDADGLNQLALLDDWPSRLPPHSILTPHPGEMARLMGLPLAELKQQNRIELARTQAQTWQHSVVLKGAYTIVAAPDGRGTVIPFANPALGTAGSGDVLAGVLLSLLGQGVERYEAAVLGCYLHALAGSLTGHASGVLARDIAAKLPQARQHLINFERDA